MLNVREETVLLPHPKDGEDLLAHFAKEMKARLGDNVLPTRFVVNETTANEYRCDIAVLEGGDDFPEHESIFEYRRRDCLADGDFNIVMIVPTGVGAEYGAHAGDATPAARLLASTCDTLVTHPNVVNASDINEMTPNTMYVEGSVINRLLMGTVGLQPSRSNRLMVISENHPVDSVSDASINSINGSRAASGYNCTKYVKVNPPFEMHASFTADGRAAGKVIGIDRVFRVLDEYKGQYDAVAILSQIVFPKELAMQYLKGDADSVNPWGGVEAMLTHAISGMYHVPSAHAPQAQGSNGALASWGVGVVEPTHAAEVVSTAYAHCVYKGLHTSPRLVRDRAQWSAPSVIDASNISALVTPDRCVGLPLLAALQQGIPVIAVRDSQNRMKNDLTDLPWQPGQLQFADSYFEAAGMLMALRHGVSIDTVQRPLARVSVDMWNDRRSL